MEAPVKKLRVAVIGPKGQCGQCVVDELLTRGHSVVGISRSPPMKWRTLGEYSAVAVDIADTDALAKAFSDNLDAIVCAFGPPVDDLSKTYEACVEGHARIKTALLKSTHTGPFIIIGGAGSLHMKSGKQLVDTDEFVYSWWYTWPDVHFDYMRQRAYDHGTSFFKWFIILFKWARNNVEKPGWLSWLGRPFAYLTLRWAHSVLTSSGPRSLITGSRIALVMYEGVRDKSWTFLSPPGLLRDKGIRTGKYRLFIDSPESPAVSAVQEGIYNEDMAVAIVDEAEKDNLAFKHWSCTGQIDLKDW